MYKLIFTVLATVVLTGCVVVDKFSDRAVTYNQESEKVQDQDLLLNIVRASKRRPLEFTGVQTISGNATATGGSSLSIPFGHGPHPTQNALGLSDSFSGGPTFSVSVLDTQEFYQGVLKPIPLTTLDFYNRQRYSRTMLINLFIGNIIFKRGDKTLEVQNLVGKDQDLEMFQIVADYLLNNGLTTEAKQTVTPYGPLRTASEALDIGDTSKAAAAGLEIKEVKACELTQAEVISVMSRLKLEGHVEKLDQLCSQSLKSGPNWVPSHADLNAAIPGMPVSMYRVQKVEKGFQFCFESRVTESGKQPQGQPFKPGKAACGQSKARESIQRKGGRTESIETTRASESSFNNISISSLGPMLQPYLHEKGIEKAINFSQRFDSLELVPRSTEGVIYYLGEVVRRELDPDFNAVSRVVSVKYGPSDKPVPVARVCGAPTPTVQNDFNCEPLFMVNWNVDDKGKVAENSGSFVNVNYDNKTYSISPTGVGRTYQILDIVTQLVALNKSAKDVPATSVFTLVGNP